MCFIFWNRKRLAKDEFNLEVQQIVVCRFAPEGRDVLLKTSSVMQTCVSPVGKPSLFLQVDNCCLN
jgi:hypothetical protein